MTKPGSAPARLLAAGRFLLLASFILLPALADPKEPQLKVQLVWATEHPKPKPELKELDTKLSNKLRKTFKWKNYFEINQQTVILPATGSRKLTMSPKCTLELKRLDDGFLEVKLFGEGKLVKTIRQPIAPLEKGEFAALAGDDKESYGDAWFVVLSAPKP